MSFNFQPGAGYGDNQGYNQNNQNQQWGGQQGGPQYNQNQNYNQNQQWGGQQGGPQYNQNQNYNQQQGGPQYNQNQNYNQGYDQNNQNYNQQQGGPQYNQNYNQGQQGGQQWGPQGQQQGGQQGGPQQPLKFTDLWKTKYIDGERIHDDGIIYFNFLVNLANVKDIISILNTGSSKPLKNMMSNHLPNGPQFLVFGNKHVKSYDPDFFTTPLTTYEFGKGKDLFLTDFDWNPATNTVLVAARGDRDRKHYHISKLDLNTSTFTEVADDGQLETITALSYVAGTSPQVMACYGENIRVHDLETGRPLITEKDLLKCKARASRSSPTDPNIVYVSCEANSQKNVQAQQLLVFDIRQKSFQAAQNFVGVDLRKLNSFEVPKVPGNLIIAAGKPHAANGNAVNVFDSRKQTPLHTLTGTALGSDTQEVVADIHSNLLACFFVGSLTNNVVRCYDIEKGLDNVEVEVKTDRWNGDNPGIAINPRSQHIMITTFNCMWKIPLGSKPVTGGRK